MSIKNSVSTNSMFKAREWSKWNQRRWGSLQPNNIYWRLLDMRENSFKERLKYVESSFSRNYLWKPRFLKHAIRSYWLQMDFV